MAAAAVDAPVLEHPKPQPDPPPTIVPTEPEPAPAPPSEAEKPKKYTCKDRDAMIAAFLATNPSLPIVKKLPSGERVYIDEKHQVTHYDGPTCEP